MKQKLCLPIILALTLAIFAGLSGCGEKAVRFLYPMIPPTGGEGELSYELSPELTFPEDAEIGGVPRDALGGGGIERPRKFLQL